MTITREQIEERLNEVIALLPVQHQYWAAERLKPVGDLALSALNDGPTSHRLSLKYARGAEPAPGADAELLRRLDIVVPREDGNYYEAWKVLGEVRAVLSRRQNREAGA